MSRTNYIWNDVSTTLHLPQDDTTLHRAACKAVGRRIRDNDAGLRRGRYTVCAQCRTILGL